MNALPPPLLVAAAAELAAAPAAALAEAPVFDRSFVPKPDKCGECGKGPDEVDYKWRTDVVRGGWRSSCNACYNLKSYDVAWRQRQREADEPAYKAHNAKTHLAWAHKNPDNVLAQQHLQHTVPIRKVKQIATSAKRWGIVFPSLDDDITVDEMCSMLSRYCHYCGYPVKEDDVLNGIDRVDPSLGYIIRNLVPCCSTCSAMKGACHTSTFIFGIRAIAKHRGLNVSTAAGVPRIFIFDDDDVNNAVGKLQQEGADAVELQQEGADVVELQEGGGDFSYEAKHSRLPAFGFQADADDPQQDCADAVDLRQQGSGFGGEAKRSQLPAFGGRADLLAKDKKLKTDELTSEERLDLWFSPYTYCDRSPAFGVDRIDSDGINMRTREWRVVSADEYRSQRMSAAECKSVKRM
ncbi:hypothetical protein FOA52_013179 [Chlamydomonas sp. UWO 241]|nr:hypothetical protein FOA52_013179 [Chlamydomonas sp. UWO 241]